MLCNHFRLKEFWTKSAEVLSSTTETVLHTDIPWDKCTCCYPVIQIFLSQKSDSKTPWTAMFLLTLYIWKVFLVLVYLATKNCKSQSLEEHSALFQLYVSVSKQIERTALSHCHSCWNTKWRAQRLTSNFPSTPLKVANNSCFHCINIA